jgi:hypothetical protein
MKTKYIVIWNEKVESIHFSSSAATKAVKKCLELGGKPTHYIAKIIKVIKGDSEVA